MATSAIWIFASGAQREIKFEQGKVRAPPLDNADLPCVLENARELPLDDSPCGLCWAAEQMGHAEGGKAFSVGVEMMFDVKGLGIRAKTEDRRPAPNDHIVRTQ